MANKKEYELALKIGARVDKSVDSSVAKIEKKLGSMTKVAAGVGAAFAAVQVGDFIKDYTTDAISQAMEFEKTMAGVVKVVDGLKNPDGSYSEMFYDMKDSITELSTQIPMTVNDIGEIVASAGQAGIASDELLRFSETAAKMGIAFDSTAADAGQWMATWRTSMNLTQDEVEKLADQINYLGNTSSEDALKLSDVVTRVGALGKMAGLHGGEVAALAASMPGVQSEIAATGIKNMTKAMTAGASATKKQQGVLKKLGFDANTLADNMQKNATGSIISFMEAVAALPKAEQTSVMTQYFGSESVASVSQLVSNLDNLKAQFNKVADASLYAGSMEKEYQSVADTTANKVILMQNRINANKVTIGESLLPLADKGTELIARYDDIIVGKVIEHLPKIESTIDYVIDNSDEILEKLEAAAKIGAAIWATDKVVRYGNSAVKTIDMISKTMPLLTTSAAPTGVTVASILAPIAGVAAMSTAPFAVVTAGYYGISKAIETYQQSLIDGGLNAGELADGTIEIRNRTASISNMYNEYMRLKDMKSTGNATSADLQKTKELEQWFIDNYGQFISAEEQKNGIRQESIDFINEYNQGLQMKKQLELEETYQAGEEKIPKLQKEITNKTAVNEELSSKIKQADELAQVLEVVRQRYNAINESKSGEDRRKAIADLKTEFGTVFENFENLTGEELRLTDLDGQIKNLKNSTSQWTDQMAANRQQIISSKSAIEGYKKAMESLSLMQSNGKYKVLPNMIGPQMNARGTSYADDIFIGGEEGIEAVYPRSGSPFLIGQYGPELVTGYEGARVYSNSETMSMLQKNRSTLRSAEYAISQVSSSTPAGDRNSNGASAPSIVFSPTIQIQGNAYEAEVRNAMNISYDEFKKMMNTYIRDNQRKVFV